VRVLDVLEGGSVEDEVENGHRVRSIPSLNGFLERVSES